LSGRIVVLVSGTGSNMEALIDACRDGHVPGDVVAVIADRECEGLAKAAQRDVATVALRPKDFASRDVWSEALRDEVARFEPDLVVSAGFMRILAPVFVDAFAGRLINLHPSLLPAFPGAHAVRDALEAGAKVTGTTLHHVDHGVDTGRIIAQRSIEVRPDDDEATLHERIKEVERNLLPEVCAQLLRAPRGGTKGDG
jgi:phosphoribosylglycinamide formyltransferase-1